MELLFHWIRFAFIAWGLIYIATQSTIMLPLRLIILKLSPSFLGVLIFCPTCTGFWVGVLLGATGLYGVSLSPISPTWLESALVVTVLGHFWGEYWGDAYGYQKARYALGLDTPRDA